MVVLSSYWSLHVVVVHQLKRSAFLCELFNCVVLWRVTLDNSHIAHDLSVDVLSKYLRARQTCKLLELTLFLCRNHSGDFR